MTPIRSLLCHAPIITEGEALSARFKWLAGGPRGYFEGSDGERYVSLSMTTTAQDSKANGLLEILGKQCWREIND
jgi:hypothetical protein